MNQIIKIELFKIYKSKIFIPVLILLIIFSGLSIVMSWHDPGLNKNYLRYNYYLFMINGELIFPLIASMFFGPLITREYRDKTISIMYSSHYTKDQIIISKFFSGAIFYSFVYLFIFSMYQAVVLLFFVDLSTIEVLYTNITFSTALFRSYIIAINYLAYLLAFGSLTYCIGVLSKKYAITILLPIASVLFYMFIPHKEWMKTFIFFTKSNSYQLLGFDDFPYYPIFSSVLLCLITVFVFLLLSVYVLKLENFVFKFKRVKKIILKSRFH